MRKFEDYVPIIVQTRKGDVPIEDIHVGDIVYGFETGEEYEVQSVIDSFQDVVYEVTYNDGRVEYYREFELIYTGDTFINLATLFKQDDPLGNASMDLKPHQIDYTKNIVVESLSPDPYIAGALLIHGNRREKYLNLPLDRFAANQHFAHKYQLNYGNRLENNMVFFSYNGAPDDRLITWEEFFPNSIMDRTKDSFLIPSEYQRASVDDRWQFIRGVFDIGYTKDMFLYGCGIANVSENRLTEVQKILWSLGVLSTITYDPRLPAARGREFRLDLQIDPNTYPRFFYYIDFIEDMILNEQRFVRRDPEFKLRFRSAKLYGRGYAKNLVLDKPQALYLTSNFLPRISV